ncbi:MAG TPA: glycoside hydrolase family 2 TIM barrel-domain containing protein [Gemmatimonadaceae bacterium]|nr:glycoside hydrolase family 2 TIM barrel-domain containing protein [Gemmatimonadaceae bacterium]
MDPGWRFTLGDPAGAERPEFDDGSWRGVDLPHDWSIEGTPHEDAPGGGRVGYFPSGIGWYRKAFRLPGGASFEAREVWLEFDGVYMNSDVWINGHHLGHRPYGYSSFAYDATPYLVRGVNVVAVRVDNSRQPNSRWYTGSGIYRHTWLTVVNDLHVGHWGTYVTTPRVDSSGATVAVHTRVENDHPVGRRGILRSIVLGADGRVVARSETTLALRAGEKAEVKQALRVTAPRLWSTGTPVLYTLRSELLDGANTVDTLDTRFGIRTIAYDADSGFSLNGKRVKLLGVNLHHDGGAVGAAVPERVWKRRLEVLKSMGANAIRTSHNPPAPEFLDLCDRLGLLVMAEALDEWTVGKVDEGYHRYFDEWSERDLTDFIHRDRNHPSIVLWSAGNEIGEQSMPGGEKVLERLVGIFHAEDPSRPVTTGNDHIYADDGATTVAFLGAEDVVGYNYVDRWHERRELFAEPDRHDHPDWKMIGTESVSARGAPYDRYSLGDDSAAIQPNYTTGMLRAERLWKWVAMHDYFAGDFMWTGIDYLGESEWPAKGADFGPIDIAGHPKDSYYLYRSLWTNAPVLHLFPHWNWPGREGQLVPVIAYTNCNSVELFLNGRSLGEKRIEFPAQGTTGGWNSYAEPVVHSTTDDLHLEWDVPYEPGVLEAVGRRRDGKEACRGELRTAGPPAAIRLTTERDTITTAHGDVASITFEVVDSAGVVVPTASDELRFSVSGAGGEIVALDNADLTDHEPYRSDHRKAFNGRGLAIVRATRPGALRVSATAKGLRGAVLSTVVVHGRAPPSIPAAR